MLLWKTCFCIIFSYSLVLTLNSFLGSSYIYHIWSHISQQESLFTVVFCCLTFIEVFILVNSFICEKLWGIMLGEPVLRFWWFALGLDCQLWNDFFAFWIPKTFFHFFIFSVLIMETSYFQITFGHSPICGFCKYLTNEIELVTKPCNSIGSSNCWSYS